MITKLVIMKYDFMLRNKIYINLTKVNPNLLVMGRSSKAASITTICLKVKHKPNSMGEMGQSIMSIQCYCANEDYTFQKTNIHGLILRQ